MLFKRSLDIFILDLANEENVIKASIPVNLKILSIALFFNFRYLAIQTSYNRIEIYELQSKRTREINLFFAGLDGEVPIVKYFD